MFEDRDNSHYVTPLRDVPGVLALPLCGLWTKKIVGTTVVSITRQSHGGVSSYCLLITEEVKLIVQTLRPMGRYANTWKGITGQLLQSTRPKYNGDTAARTSEPALGPWQYPFDKCPCVIL